LQNWRTGRHELPDDNNECNQVHNSIGRKICLIVGLERVQNPMWDKIAERGCVDGHRRDEGEDKICACEPEYGPCPKKRLEGLSAAKRDPGAEEKQDLPGERIEIPEARGRGRQIPAKMPRSKIHSHRADQCKRRLADHEPQRGSKGS
jgi:hypothetical protein